MAGERGPETGGENGMDDSAEGLREEGRHIREEAGELAADVGELVEEVGDFVRDQAIQRPYVTLGAAFGIGYVLGGGVPLWMVRSLVAIGGKIAVSAVLAELTRAASSGEGPPSFDD
jgi:hypothetical protein